MANLCQLSRNSVSVQADVFRYAERDHGLSVKVLHLRTDIAVNTLRDWASGNTAMPAWALFKLGRQGGVPDHLLSLIGEGFERHVGTDEPGQADLDDAAQDANAFQAAVQRARNPNSPGGVAIVPQEVAEIIPLGRKSIATTRRAVVQ